MRAPYCSLSVHSESLHAHAHLVPCHYKILRSSLHNRSYRCNSLESQPLTTSASGPEVSVDQLSVDESWSGEALSSMSALMKRFKRADTDGNGVIDRSELRGLLQTVDSGDEIVPMSWMTEDDLERIMSQYDANRDGVIQFEEYTKMAQDGVLLEGKLMEYQQAFRYLDRDGDGKLGARELFELFERVGHPITYKALVKVFDEYDVNETGTIEFAEFLRMFRSKLLHLDQILDYVAMEGKPWKVSDCGVGPEKDTAPPSGTVAEISSQADLDSVLCAHQDTLVALMATLSWCSPSRGVCRDFEALSRRYPGAIFLRLDGNACPAAKDLFKDKLKCRATPSFYFFRHGRLCSSYQGSFPEKVEREIRLHLFPDDLPTPLYQPEEVGGAQRGSE